MQLIQPTLPRLSAKQITRPVPQPATVCRHPYPTILLVDDDASVRESMRRVLVNEGLRVVTADSGNGALVALELNEPDLMITDLCMAATDGWDLMIRESRLRPTLPIFVITALSPRDACGADVAADAFFQKPLDFDALITAIRRYLGTSNDPFRRL